VVEEEEYKELKSGDDETEVDGNRDLWRMLELDVVESYDELT
jgi:hypothetical protein